MLEKFWAVPQGPSRRGALPHPRLRLPAAGQAGLPRPRSNASIAPRVPHALPCVHIFIRLGMWKEAIDSNTPRPMRARAYTAQRVPDATSFEELHADDYLVYAYCRSGGVQGGGDREEGRHHQEDLPPKAFAAAYAMGATRPACHRAPRLEWASELTVPEMEFWNHVPSTRRTSNTPRMGRARSGDARAQEIARPPRRAARRHQGSQVRLLQEPHRGFSTRP